MPDVVLAQDAVWERSRACVRGGDEPLPAVSPSGIFYTAAGEDPEGRPATDKTTIVPALMSSDSTTGSRPGQSTGGRTVPRVLRLFWVGACRLAVGEPVISVCVGPSLTLMPPEGTLPS